MVRLTKDGGGYVSGLVFRDEESGRDEAWPQRQIAELEQIAAAYVP